MESFRAMFPSVPGNLERVADGLPTLDGGNRAQRREGPAPDDLSVPFVLGGSCLSAWPHALPAIGQGHPENPVPEGWTHRRCQSDL